MATRAELLVMLSEAEMARHQLLLGGSVRVTVDRNGERVEFTAANRADLEKYITGLKIELGLMAPRSPAGAFF